MTRASRASLPKGVFKSKRKRLKTKGSRSHRGRGKVAPGRKVLGKSDRSATNSKRMKYFRERQQIVDVLKSEISNIASTHFLGSTAVNFLLENKLWQITRLHWKFPGATMSGKTTQERRKEMIDLLVTMVAMLQEVIDFQDEEMEQ